MRMYELTPNTAQKSFYGKATVCEDANGCTLYSYSTAVAAINTDGELVRLWDSWSATTAKHIRAFCEAYGLPVINKATWDMMPVIKEA